MSTNTGFVKINTDSVNIDNIEDNATSFIVDFHDGFTLRGVVELIIKFCLPTIKFIFGDKGIVGISYNNDKTIVIPFTINANKLVRYSFNGKKPFMCTFKTGDIDAIFNEVKKNKSIRLFKKSDSPSIKYVYNIETNNNDDEGGIINVLPDDTLENVEYPVFNYTPNCVIPITKAIEYFKAPTTKNKNKNNVIMNFYEEGLAILINDTSGAPYVYKYGTINDNSNSDIKNLQSTRQSTDYVDTYTFESNIFKALLSLQIINSKGVIQFYCEKNKPLLLVSDISYYGEIKILLNKHKKK